MIPESGDRQHKSRKRRGGKRRFLSVGTEKKWASEKRILTAPFRKKGIEDMA